jgi:MFS family permease
MIGIIVVGGVALATLSHAPHLAVVAVCVFFGSACVNNMVAVANLALLAHAPEHMRGQALTLMNIVLGTILIGTLLAGALADSLGPRFGLLTIGACLLGAAVLALSTPRVRWWLW